MKKYAIEAKELLSSAEMYHIKAGESISKPPTNPNHCLFCGECVSCAPSCTTCTTSCTSCNKIALDVIPLPV